MGAMVEATSTRYRERRAAQPVAAGHMGKEEEQR
jgi:hypothetical protein